jgi:transposase
MKSMLVCLGITGFNIKLYKATQKLATLRTPNGEPIPPHTLAELYRGLERLSLIRKQIKAFEQAREQRLKAKPNQGSNPLALMLAQVLGLGLETADLLVHEVLTWNLCDHRAMGRYGGLTGSPDEGSNSRREQGLAKAGVERVLDAVFLLLHLDLGGAADADDRDAAGKHRQPLGRRCQAAAWVEWTSELSKQGALQRPHLCANVERPESRRFLRVLRQLPCILPPS